MSLTRIIAAPLAAIFLVSCDRPAVSAMAQTVSPDASAGADAPPLATALDSFTEASCLKPQIGARAPTAPVNPQQSRLNAAMASLTPALQAYFHVDQVLICNGDTFDATFAINKDSGAISYFSGSKGQLPLAGDMYTSLQLLSEDRTVMMLDPAIRVMDSVLAARIQIGYRGWQIAQAAYAMDKAGHGDLLAGLRDPAVSEDEDTLLRLAASFVRIADENKAIAAGDAGFVAAMQRISTDNPDVFHDDDTNILANYVAVMREGAAGPFNDTPLPKTYLQKVLPGFADSALTTLGKLPVISNDPDLTALMNTLRTAKMPVRAPETPIAPVPAGPRLITA